MEVDNHVVGFVRIGAADSPYQDKGEIYALYILNGYKGFGFGKKLLLKGLDQLKKKEYKQAIVGCLVGNKSNDFYKHMGGKFIGQKDLKRGDQILKENIYLYEL